MLHEDMTAFYSTLADFHPAVLRWARDVLQAEPMLTPTFAITLNTIIQQVQFQTISEDLAHDSLIQMIDIEAGPVLSRLGISLPIPSRAVFADLARSFREDGEISKLLFQEPLVVEKGPLGMLRRRLWAEGLREPLVSIRVAAAQHPHERMQ